MVPVVSTAMPPSVNTASFYLFQGCATNAQMLQQLHMQKNANMQAVKSAQAAQAAQTAQESQAWPSAGNFSQVSWENRVATGMFMSQISALMVQSAHSENLISTCYTMRC